VPYRERRDQLASFTNYMHNYLRKQQIHYKIFIVEQKDSKPFNRAKLFNIGAKYALKENFPCLILTDVDLLPLRLGNIYACTNRPRHMSSSLDSFRFNLPYYGLFGGAVAITAETFVHINGFSNLFHGWGGEDDDFYARLVHKDYKIIRFHPKYAQYTMLKHKVRS
jgi:predicted glycosyltransferase involved in capsule biosynthesis